MSDTISSVSQPSTLYNQKETNDATRQAEIADTHLDKAEQRAWEKEAQKDHQIMFYERTSGARSKESRLAALVIRHGLV